MIWIIAISILILDQLTKYLIVANFDYLQSVTVIKDIFHLTLVHNYGAAFGILQNQRILFIAIALLVLGVIIYFYRQLPSDWISKLAIGLAIGGTIGNLIDRVRLGYVIDFFDFRIWPVFNIADSAIVVGMLLLAWKIIITDEYEEEKI